MYYCISVFLCDWKSLPFHLSIKAEYWLNLVHRLSHGNEQMDRLLCSILCECKTLTCFMAKIFFPSLKCWKHKTSNANYLQFSGRKELISSPKQYKNWRWVQTPPYRNTENECLLYKQQHPQTQPCYLTTCLKGDRRNTAWEIRPTTQCIFLYCRSAFISGENYYRKWILQGSPYSSKTDTARESSQKWTSLLLGTYCHTSIRTCSLQLQWGLSKQRLNLYFLNLYSSSYSKSSSQPRSEYQIRTNTFLWGCDIFH